MVVPTVVPAKAGTQSLPLGRTGGQTLNRQLVIEVAPLRIIDLDQFELPGAPPFLDPLFAQDRVRHGLVKFGKDQPVDAVVPDKAGNRIRPMLPNTASKIGRYANVERTVASARQDVHAWAFLRHSTRQRPWVPAFAGTTNAISA